MSNLQITLPAVLLGTACFAIAMGQVTNRDARALVHAELWSEKERADYEKGDPVVLSLPTDDKQEVSTVGIVRVSELPGVAMEVFRRSLSPKSEENLRTGGKFSRPPVATDLKDLVLDEDTITELRSCTIGRCDLNLSSAAIKRFESIDWESPSVNQDVTQIIREILVDYASRYSTAGISSLGTYDNRRKAVNLTASHVTLVQNFGPVKKLAPELRDYVANYPGATPPGVQDTLRWSVVDFGLKPSITLIHTVSYTQASTGSEQLFIVSRQFYSSRYLDSSLSFTMLLRPSDDPGAAYLIFLDRSRSDVFSGPFGGLARRAVQKEAQQRVRSMLETAHIRLLGYTRPDIGDREISNSDSQRWWLLMIFVVALAVVVLIARRKMA